MMIRTSIEKMAYDIGNDIGHASDEDQSNLINGLSHGLVLGCGDKLQMQACYIYDKLSQESKKVIVELAGFIAIEEDN